MTPPLLTILPLQWIRLASAGGLFEEIKFSAKESKDEGLLATWEVSAPHFGNDSLIVHFEKNCYKTADDPLFSDTELATGFGLGWSFNLTIANFYNLPDYIQEKLLHLELEYPIAFIYNTKKKTVNEPMWTETYIEMNYFIDNGNIKKIEGLNKYRRYCILAMSYK